MRRHRLLVAAVPLSVLALVATGCGGDSKGSGGSGGDKTVGNVYNGALSAAKNASTAKGGTLQMATMGDCDHWDPARTYYAFCWNMQRFISRGLMAYKAVPGPAGSDVIPDLASEAGKASNGNQTWTYKIRKGIKFEDGSPVTSKNVKYGIERIFAGD